MAATVRAANLPAERTPRDMTPLLRIEDLAVEIEGKEILSGISLDVPKGQVHALMGRNGSGKSSLSAVIMGHPAYTVTRGRILFEGKDLTALPAEERARLGLFLAFQYPVAIPGVSVHNLIRHSLKVVRAARGLPELDSKAFRALVKEKLEALGVDASFMTRAVNEGFSGGEKKRLEVLQMALLDPSLAILDETDSGLDVEALKVIAKAVQAMRSPDRTFLLITHYHRMLEFVRPDRVHVLMKGRIVRSGGPELAEEIDRKGYEWIAPAGDSAAPAVPAAR
jgi:Fe-S cluster assembly ATP-binding protein